jgi:hypothetical protein
MLIQKSDSQDAKLPTINHEVTVTAISRNWEMTKNGLK